MSFTLVPSGKAETAKGEPKFFEFAANGLKAADYPHLPATRVGKGEAAKDVPVIKVSPASIQVREYLTIADAKNYAISQGVSEDRFEAVVLDLLNTAERNETVKIVRSRVTDAKLLPQDLNDFVKAAADEVNIFAEIEKAGGRESFKAKQEKALAIAEQFKNDPAAMAAELMALLGVK